jgi:DNA polymerase elongation subunit (family B)
MYANKKEVKVLELIFDGSEVMTLNIERKDWIKSLRNAIKYFEKSDVEKYENCTKCMDIIKYISKDANVLNIIQNMNTDDNKIKDLI